MRHSHKMLLNTLALCVKIVIKTIALLISTKIVLREIGVNDYGLYNLIAGIISLLSFINGSLMVSTQRFLSYSIGEKDQLKLQTVFNTSLFIHVIMAVIFGLVFICIKPLLFNDFINVGSSSLEVAKTIYDTMIITAVITIGTIPYSAAINAHEDMVFFAVSEIIVIVMQLLSAIVIMFLNSDLLVVYTWLMLSSIGIGFVTKFIWCKNKYSECGFNLNLAFDKDMRRKMFGFVGWNTLGSSAVLVRNQGVALVLNYFFGTIANAAYGIANQINSLVLTFSTTLTTVFAPTIIQHKGAGNNERMRDIAMLSSKLSFLLSSLIAIPILWNLDFIFEIWLGSGQTPQHTRIFTVCIILAFLFTQIYPGINRAIYATGQIKRYQITLSICLTATIPLGILAYKIGLPIYSILLALVLTQCCTMLCTLYYAEKFVGFNFNKILYGYALPCIVLCGAFIALGYGVKAIFVADVVLIIVLSALAAIGYTFVFCKTIFNNSELMMIIYLFRNIKTKKRI